MWWCKSVRLPLWLFLSGVTGKCLITWWTKETKSTLSTQSKDLNVLTIAGFMGSIRKSTNSRFYLNLQCFRKATLCHWLPTTDSRPASWWAMKLRLVKFFPSTLSLLTLSANILSECLKSMESNCTAKKRRSEIGGGSIKTKSSLLNTLSFMT